MSTWEKVRSVLKKGVLENKHYTLKPIDANIKLNQNESPFDLPEIIKDEILSRLKQKKWNIYPDFVPTALYKKIANYYDVSSANLLIGNGSNEMINTILSATLDDRHEVIIPVPTFTVYELISRNMNAKINRINLNDDFTFDVDAIKKAATRKNSITILCSPNNPTGTFISKEDILQIVKVSNGLVVVDEAYIHFGGESVLDKINEYDNLIVLRTFSKAFGLAGLRMGMMFANEKLIIELSKVKLPYNINIFSIITLDVVFDNTDVIEKNVNFIKDERNRIFNKLRNIIDFIPSSTNFFLVKTKDSQEVFDFLLKDDILVRDVSSYPMLDNYLRINIGNKEENNKLINSLMNYSREKKVNLLMENNN